mmetsp:Transcript_42939/g.124145  ORF Transcript_42939/g.124145 Transcript_42939/m.124145 type:complete len:270 (+) Transcript_42939:64-873(+)
MAGKQPECKFCGYSGRAQWVLASGNHHNSTCPRYADCTCYDCRSCSIVGTWEWVSAEGQHHERKCGKHAATAVGQCKYCDVVGAPAAVQKKGGHHKSSCPRYEAPPGFFASCLCPPREAEPVGEEVTAPSPKAAAAPGLGAAPRKSDAAAEEVERMPTRTQTGEERGQAKAAGEDEAPAAADNSAAQEETPPPAAEEPATAEEPAPAVDSAQDGPAKVAPTAGPVTLQIQVPAGVQPGQTIQVQAPDGRLLQVQVPAGVSPGQTLQVQV